MLLTKRPNGKWRQGGSATMQPLLHSFSRVPAREHGPFLASRRQQSQPATSLIIRSLKSPQTLAHFLFFAIHYPLRLMDDDLQVSILSLALLSPGETSPTQILMIRDSHRRSDLVCNHGRPRPSSTSSQPSPRTPTASHRDPYRF